MHARTHATHLRPLVGLLAQQEQPGEPQQAHDEPEREDDHGARLPRVHLRLPGGVAVDLVHHCLLCHGYVVLADDAPALAPATATAAAAAAYDDIAACAMVLKRAEHRHLLSDNGPQRLGVQAGEVPSEHLPVINTNSRADVLRVCVCCRDGVGWAPVAGRTVVASSRHHSAIGRPAMRRCSGVNIAGCHTCLSNNKPRAAENAGANWCGSLNIAQKNNLVHVDLGTYHWYPRTKIVTS